MLVIHGGRDYRVPDTQGIATFTALQRRASRAASCYFPDENHWVLKPRNSMLWHETVLGWMDRLREAVGNWHRQRTVAPSAGTGRAGVNNPAADAAHRCSPTGRPTVLLVHANAVLALPVSSRASSRLPGTAAKSSSRGHCRASQLPMHGRPQVARDSPRRLACVPPTVEVWIGGEGGIRSRRFRADQRRRTADCSTNTNDCFSAIRTLPYTNRRNAGIAGRGHELTLRVVRAYRAFRARRNPETRRSSRSCGLFFAWWPCIRRRMSSSMWTASVM